MIKTAVKIAENITVKSIRVLIVLHPFAGGRILSQIA